MDTVVFQLIIANKSLKGSLSPFTTVSRECTLQLESTITSSILRLRSSNFGVTEIITYIYHKDRMFLVLTTLTGYKRAATVLRRCCKRAANMDIVHQVRYEVGEYFLVR